jgi:8-oxo-dGTP pyrophosphatase MutT (NUDIX family)
MTSSLRFDQQLFERIKLNLRKHEVASLQSEGRKRAAVAFTLINASGPARIGNIPHDSAHSDEAAYILTTRSAGLSSHAGQRAYPGGRVDPGETAEQAALRELAEEVGLELNGDSVLGRLDDYATRSGFVITPIVVWGGRDVDLVANPAEVELIHRIPLRELLRQDAPLLSSIEESPHPVLRMPLGDDWFAAPSAAIAYQFREVALLGKTTRVVHFEQPYFAWQ